MSTSNPSHKRANDEMDALWQFIGKSQMLLEKAKQGTPIMRAATAMANQPDVRKISELRVLREGEEGQHHPALFSPMRPGTSAGGLSSLSGPSSWIDEVRARRAESRGYLTTAGSNLAGTRTAGSQMSGVSLSRQSPMRIGTGLTAGSVYSQASGASNRRPATVTWTSPTNGGHGNGFGQGQPYHSQAQPQHGLNAGPSLLSEGIDADMSIGDLSMVADGKEEEGRHGGAASHGLHISVTHAQAHAHGSGSGSAEHHQGGSFLHAGPSLHTSQDPSRPQSRWNLPRKNPALHMNPELIAQERLHEPIVPAVGRRWEQVEQERQQARERAEAREASRRQRSAERMAMLAGRQPGGHTPMSPSAPIGGSAAGLGGSLHRASVSGAPGGHGHGLGATGATASSRPASPPTGLDATSSTTATGAGTMTKRPEPVHTTAGKKGAAEGPGKAKATSPSVGLAKRSTSSSNVDVDELMFNSSPGTPLYYGTIVALESLDGWFLTVHPTSGVVAVREPMPRWVEDGVMPFSKTYDVAAGRVQRCPLYLFRLFDLRDPTRQDVICAGDVVWLQLVEGRGKSGWTSGAVLAPYLHAGIPLDGDSVDFEGRTVEHRRLERLSKIDEGGEAAARAREVGLLPPETGIPGARRNSKDKASEGAGHLLFGLPAAAKKAKDGSKGSGGGGAGGTDGAEGGATGGQAKDSPRKEKDKDGAAADGSSGTGDGSRSPASRRPGASPGGHGHGHGASQQSKAKTGHNEVDSLVQQFTTLASTVLPLPLDEQTVVVERPAANRLPLSLVACSDGIPSAMPGRDGTSKAMAMGGGTAVGAGLAVSAALSAGGGPSAVKNHTLTASGADGAADGEGAAPGTGTGRQSAATTSKPAHDAQASTLELALFLATPEDPSGGRGSDSRRASTAGPATGAVRRRVDPRLDPNAPVGQAFLHSLYREAHVVVGKQVRLNPLDRLHLRGFARDNWDGLTPMGLPRPVTAFVPAVYSKQDFLKGPATETNPCGVYKRADPGYDVLYDQVNGSAIGLGGWRLQKAQKEVTPDGLIIGGLGIEGAVSEKAARAVARREALAKTMGMSVGKPRRRPNEIDTSLLTDNKKGSRAGAESASGNGGGDHSAEALQHKRGAPLKNFDLVYVEQDYFFLAYTPGRANAEAVPGWEEPPSIGHGRNRKAVPVDGGHEGSGDGQGSPKSGNAPVISTGRYIPDSVLYVKQEGDGLSGGNRRDTMLTCHAPGGGGLNSPYKTDRKGVFRIRMLQNSNVVLGPEKLDVEEAENEALESQGPADGGEDGPGVSSAMIAKVIAKAAKQSSDVTMAIKARSQIGRVHRLVLGKAFESAGAAVESSSGSGSSSGGAAAANSGSEPTLKPIRNDPTAAANLAKLMRQDVIAVKTKADDTFLSHEKAKFERLKDWAGFAMDRTRAGLAYDADMVAEYARGRAVAMAKQHVVTAYARPATVDLTGTRWNKREIHKHAVALAETGELGGTLADPNAPPKFDAQALAGARALLGGVTTPQATPGQVDARMDGGGGGGQGDVTGVQEEGDYTAQHQGFGHWSRRGFGSSDSDSEDEAERAALGHFASMLPARQATLHAMLDQDEELNSMHTSMTLMQNMLAQKKQARAGGKGAAAAVTRR